MRTRLPALVAMTLLACAAGSSFSRAAGEASPIDASRQTLARWVETQQLIAKEKRDWQEGKQILAGRIALMQAEIAALEASMKEQRDSGSETVTKQNDLARESGSLESAEKALKEWATGLEGSLHTLEPRLPDPLRTRLAPLYGRMPRDASATTVSLAERFQNIVGILNEINKFNGEVGMVNEVRTLASGKPAEVRTIYAGLAQAWYLSAGGEAGVGRPGPEGWAWTPDNSLAPSIGQAVEILQSKSKPAFVPLPVRIQ